MIKVWTIMYTCMLFICTLAQARCTSIYATVHFSIHTLKKDLRNTIGYADMICMHLLFFFEVLILNCQWVTLHVKNKNIFTHNIFITLKMSGSPWLFATWHQTIIVWVFGNNHSNLSIGSDLSSDKKAEGLHKLMGCKNRSYSPEPVKHIARQPYLWLHSHRYSLTSQILITAAKLIEILVI